MDDDAREIYGRTWPPFFEWQRSGASFEILALDPTGADVGPADISWPTQ